MNSRVTTVEALPVLRRHGVSPAEDRDAVDVRAVLRVFWMRRWLILGSMLVTGALIFGLMRQITPTYTAYARVILDSRKSQIVTDNQVVADLTPSMQIVNGEIAIIRSNILIGDVVAALDKSHLDHLDPALREKSLLAELKSSLRGLFPSEAKTSRSPLSPEELREIRLIGAIKRHLKVYNETDSFVISIKFEADDPVIAQTIANKIAERYIAVQLDVRKGAIDQATNWLERRLGTLEQEVEAAEAAVASFRAERLVVDGGTLENASEQLSNLNSQLILTRAERAEAEAELEQLNRVVAQSGLARAAVVVSTPAIDALHAEALVLRQQDAVWARSYGPEHARRLEIQRELSDINAALETEVARIIELRRSELAIARSREERLSKSIAETEQQVLSISRNQLGLKQLERQASARRQGYESLLTRITEARTQMQLQEADAKLIEYAMIPEVPSAPRPKLMAIVGASIAGSLTIALVFFNQMTLTTFRSVRELEAETGLPVLSSLPLEPWPGIKEGIAALRANPYSIYGERIRQLRTSLLVANGKDTTRSILVLSSVPGEGKTMTAVALAEMSAIAGKSTILVDFDLRRSTVQKTFGWDIPNDLSDFIENRCTFDEAIYSPEEFDFDVMAATGPRHGAVEELAVGWLKPMIGELKRVYDTVIIDAPALMVVSDAMILAQAVDSRIYVVGYDSTPRSVVTEGLARLGRMRLGVSGIVLNKLDPRKSPDPYSEGYDYDA